MNGVTYELNVRLKFLPCYLEEIGGVPTPEAVAEKLQEHIIHAAGDVMDVEVHPMKPVEVLP